MQLLYRQKTSCTTSSKVDVLAFPYWLAEGEIVSQSLVWTCSLRHFLSRESTNWHTWSGWPVPVIYYYYMVERNRQPGKKILHIKNINRCCSLHSNTWRGILQGVFLSMWSHHMHPTLRYERGYSKYRELQLVFKHFYYPPPPPSCTTPLMFIANRRLLCGITLYGMCVHACGGNAP